MKLKKGDLVEVLTGEEKGRRGKILEIIKDKKRNIIRAVVEGVNLVKKHQRTIRADRPGGIIEIPSPISVANLGLLCPKCGKITKVRREVIEGKRKRVCKLCQEIID
ncbi:MAG: 50S ribosomal protein L24 [candidate division WOR-3 bacterium]